MRCRFLFILLICGGLRAQVQEVTTPYSGMADANYTVYSPWSVHSNQAGISRLSGIYSGVSYKHIFDLKELGVKSAFIVLPSGWGNFGLVFNYFGYDKYNEKRIGLGYGKQLADFADIGIKINYLNADVAKQTTSHGLFFFELGTIFTLYRELRLGLYTSNPFAIVRHKDLFLSEKYTVGLSWKLDPLFTLASKLENTDGVWLFFAGIEFSHQDFLFVRSGFKSGNDTFCAGVSIAPGPLEISVNYETDNLFGNTLGVTLLWCLKRK
ncbi:hypothetical protein LJB85_02005 [Porphyromonadaceae bacterium OttesenSCG-928-L07]|nr:hypothetical protein [Porphyromonadaceae bacterium OttesenSCG-928-L07]MDL2252093.1 hypothetical protein [Odoribacter sp. OttesenSCG-928-J03]MDL2330840.1 hypothetical protein [Odoribacter sp. OttesenSCG-928-A06]